MKRLLYTLLLLAASASPAIAADATRGTFGTLPDGRAVESVTLTNAHGMRATILAYGAILPNTPNQPGFGSARLDPGQTYRNRIVYRFSTH